jgi:hypothetical protein
VLSIRKGILERKFHHVLVLDDALKSTRALSEILMRGGHFLWVYSLLGIFLFTAVSRMALGPTQPPIQWVPGVLSLAVKRPGREDNHILPSSAKVTECVELYLHFPNTPWRGS